MANITDLELPYLSGQMVKTFFVLFPQWQLEAMNRRLHGQPTEAYNDKLVDFERGMKQLERKLKEGSALETGQRGSNKVSAMAQQLANKTTSSESQVPQAELQKSNSRPVLNLPPQGGSESCHFCQKRVYLMERMTAEGKFFHRGCFRCEYCGTTLRLGGYAFVRDDLVGGLFFCTSHVSMTYYMRTKFLSSNKAHDQADSLQAAPTAAGESTAVAFDTNPALNATYKSEYALSQYII